MDAIENFAKKVVERARFNLKLKGFGGQKRNRNKDASGKLSKSLDYRLTETSSGFVLDFIALDYAAIVEKGRNKGAYTPIAQLKKWVREKKIRVRKVKTINGRKVNKFAQKTDKSVTSMAIATSNSNKKTGIKGVPFFTEALDTTFEREEASIQDQIVNNLEDLTFKNFQKNGGIG